MNQNLCDRVRLDSIMCVMDAAQIFAAPEMMELKLRQIAFADMLILNKADLVSRDEIARIRAWLDEHFHRYRLVEATRGEVPLEILLSAGRFDAAQLDATSRSADFSPLQLPKTRSAAVSSGAESTWTMKRAEARAPEQSSHMCSDAHCSHPEHHHHAANHTNTFSTWSYETDQPLSLETLREVVRKLPASIYRCKGVIHSTDEPTRRAVLQVVGKRVDISIENEWGDRAPRTQIVAIGAHGTVDGALLRERFETCIASPQTQALFAK